MSYHVLVTGLGKVIVTQTDSLPKQKLYFSCAS